MVIAVMIVMTEVTVVAQDGERVKGVMLSRMTTVQGSSIGIAA